MNDLEGLFSEIEELHYHEVCISPSEIDDLEIRLGHSLPDDVRAFYRRYQTAKLFVCEDGDTSYRFVSVREIHPTRQDIYGIDTNEWGPSTWMTICDVQDGNYIALDIASKNGDEYNYIDCFHETFAIPGACEVVAKSFTELLERALHGPETGLYYLEESFRGYGDALELTPENAIERIDNPDPSKKAWFIRFYHNGTAHHTYFPDSEYGDSESSYRAAKEYVERNSK